MNIGNLELSILWPAFLAGLLVLATHVPLGQQVLNRGIVFIDLAIAQCRAALRTNPSDQESLYHLIQALRQSGSSGTEMADLVKRLADLRRESREQEGAANQYKLYEVEPKEPNGQPELPR